MSDERTNTRPTSSIYADHWCDHSGCVKWGSFGKERGRSVTEWRCMEHLASDYWDGRTVVRNAVVSL